MIVKILCCVCLFLFSLNLFAQNGDALFRIWDVNGKEGYINGTGKIVVNPQFDAVTEFSEGFAAVKVGDKWGYINAQGAITIQPRWKSNDGWVPAVMPFHEGFAVVTEYAGWGVLDDSNYWTYNCGYINRKGEYVVPPRLRQSCGDVKDGLAIIAMDFNDPKYEKGKGWVGYMNTKGNWLTPSRFFAASYFVDGAARVKDESGEYFIDKAGRRIAKPARECQWSNNFYEGLALAFSEKEKRYDGFINEQCEYAFKLAAEIKTDDTRFAEGLAAVYKETADGKLFGYIDRTGKLIIPFQFAAASSFSEGLAAVTIDKKDERTFAYINRQGEIILNNTKSNALFKNGLAFHHLHTWTISERPNGRNIYGYMNRQGKYVWLSPRAQIYLDKEWIKKNYIGEKLPEGR